MEKRWQETLTGKTVDEENYKIDGTITLVSQEHVPKKNSGKRQKIFQLIKN